MLLYVGCGPLTVTVTTRIITYLVGDSYKPSCATVTGKGPHPNYMWIFRHHQWRGMNIPNKYHGESRVTISNQPKLHALVLQRKSSNITINLHFLMDPKMGNLMIPCQRIWDMFTWLSDLFCEFFVCHPLLLQFNRSSDGSLIQYFHAVKKKQIEVAKWESTHSEYQLMIWVHHHSG